MFKHTHPDFLGYHGDELEKIYDFLCLNEEFKDYLTKKEVEYKFSVTEKYYGILIEDKKPIFSIRISFDLLLKWMKSYVKHAYLLKVIHSTEAENISFALMYMGFTEEGVEKIKSNFENKNNFLYQVLAFIEDQLSSYESTLSMSSLDAPLDTISEEGDER